jgi:hypothetical protein
MPSDPCRDLLLLVRELHLLGYERLRIAPSMSPSGVHWRCSIAPASDILRAHGARLAQGSRAASYSSASERAYFGWEDTEGADPRRLAERFIERFPEIAAAGRGADPAYATWYAEMLRSTEPDALPIAFADWPTPDDCMTTVAPAPGPARRVPLPPPGKALR